MMSPIQGSIFFWTMKETVCPFYLWLLLDNVVSLLSFSTSGFYRKRSNLVYWIWMKTWYSALDWKRVRTGINELYFLCGLFKQEHVYLVSANRTLYPWLKSCHCWHTLWNLLIWLATEILYSQSHTNRFSSHCLRC